MFIATVHLVPLGVLLTDHWCWWVIVRLKHWKYEG